MKLTYINVNDNLFAIIKTDATELHVAVENQTPAALLEHARELRDDAEVRLRRASMIEQAALLL